MNFDLLPCAHISEETRHATVATVGIVSSSFDAKEVLLTHNTVKLCASTNTISRINRAAN